MLNEERANREETKLMDSLENGPLLLPHQMGVSFSLSSSWDNGYTQEQT